MRIFFLMLTLLFTACQTTPRVMKFTPQLTKSSPKVTQPSNPPLFEAVKSGNLTKVKEILESNNTIDLNHAEKKKYPILHLAAAWKKPEIIKYLILKGAKVDVKTYDGFYPIHIASQLACIPCIKTLLNNGADINRENKKDKVFPLASAIISKNIKAIKFLLANGAKVDVAKGMMVSPLGMAVRSHSLDIVKLLMENGDKKHHIDDGLYFAIMFGRLDIVKYLLSKSTTVWDNKNSMNHAIVAASNKRDEILEYFITTRQINVNIQEKNGQTMLHTAALRGNEKIVKLLLKYNIKKSVKDNKNKTALDYAKERKKNKIIKLLQ